MQLLGTVRDTVSVLAILLVSIFIYSLYLSVDPNVQQMHLAVNHVHGIVCNILFNQQNDDSVMTHYLTIHEQTKK